MATQNAVNNNPNAVLASASFANQGTTAKFLRWNASGNPSWVSIYDYIWDTVAFRHSNSEDWTTSTMISNMCSCVDWSWNIYIVWFSEKYWLNFEVLKSTDLWVSWTSLWWPTVYASTRYYSFWANTPKICVDGNGKVWIIRAWLKTWVTGATNLYFWYYNWSTRSIEIVSAETTSWYNIVTFDMFVSSDNKRHVWFSQKSSTSTTSAQLSYNVRTAWDAWSWAWKTKLDDANGNALGTKIICDSNNYAYILFVDWWDSSKLKVDTNKSWSWAVTASTYTPWNVDNPVIDWSNNIYIPNFWNWVINKLDTTLTWSQIATEYWCTNPIELAVDSSWYLYAVNMWYSSTWYSATRSWYNTLVSVQKYTGTRATTKQIIRNNPASMVWFCIASQNVQSTPYWVIQLPNSKIAVVTLTW